jgi:hypothetical protein
MSYPITKMNRVQLEGCEYSRRNSQLQNSMNPDLNRFENVNVRPIHEIEVIEISL